MSTKLTPLCLGGLSIGTTEFVMMGLLPSVASSFHVTNPQAAYGIASYALGVVIGAPLLTLWGSHLPPKKHLTLLMLLFTVFNTLTAFAPNLALLCLARLLSGLPHGAFFGVGSVVATRLTEKEKHAQAISIMFAGLTIANLLTVPLGTKIGLELSWRYVFGGIGALGFLTLLAIHYFLPALSAEKPPSIKEQLTLFHRVEPWLILLLTTIGTGGFFCWVSYINPLMTHVSGFSEKNMFFIMMWIGVGMFVGNVFGGQLADRKTPISACLILLLAMAATLLAVHFLSGNKALSLVLAFIAGSCAMAIGSPIQNLMIQSSKGSELLGASLTQAAFNMGNALGAFLGGLPVTAGYGYTSPQLVGMGMALTGSCFAYMLMKILHRQHITRPEPELIYEVCAE